MITTSVKFSFESVYSTINNGGAFDIFGIPCIEPEAIINDKQSEKIILKCNHNFVNQDVI